MAALIISSGFNQNIHDDESDGTDEKNNRPGIILELLGLVAAERLICRLEIFRGW